jgi:cation:H+ antiporter
MSGNAAVSIGNILGSNITNLGFVIAIPAIIAPIKIKRGTFEKLPTILFLSSIIPLFFLTMEQTSFYVGILLVSAFIFFALYSMKKNISLKLITREPTDILKKFFLPLEFYKAALFLAIGILIVIISSTYVVTSASSISSAFGIAESVVGATIIAIGTSMPELSISIAAIRTKHSAMAIGNTIGSCLTNITLVLGAVLLLSPATINISIFSTLLLFVIGITMVSWYFFTTGRTLDRREGLTLMFIYILFLISTFGVQVTIK